MVLKQFEPKKIYIRVNAQPITTSGIYHNSDLGLISLSSDGSNWITIADKNLGATQVYNSGDTLSEANCGKYYQRGNNYGFPRTGAVTTSYTQVNASTYGPGNYYSSSTFIIGGVNWDSSNNANLRGGQTGTNEATQGPSPSGFHVPLQSEWTNINNIGISLGAWTNGGVGLATYLKLPLSGQRRRSDGAVTNQNSNGFYYTSKAYSTYNSYIVLTGSSYTSLGGAGDRAEANSIRPFKNDAVQPDDSRTKLY